MFILIGCLMDEKKEGYMYGGSDEGSYWCPECMQSHHKLSWIGKFHKKFIR